MNMNNLINFLKEEMKGYSNLDYQISRRIETDIKNLLSKYKIDVEITLDDSNIDEYIELWVKYKRNRILELNINPSTYELESLNIDLVYDNVKFKDEISLKSLKIIYSLINNERIIEDITSIFQKNLKSNN